MTDFSKALFAGLAGTLFASAAGAADLRAAPVTIETLPGSRTTTLTLINDAARPLKAQIRVYRWSEENGRETLTPTRDVVASPPLASLAPKQHYLVRIVRTAKASPVGEESYRLLVDEVPNPADVRPGAVQIVLRQSIPAFFSDAPRRAAKVDWSIARDGSKVWLIGRNSGNRRLRLSDLVLDVGGRQVYSQAGLVGYVLAGTEMRWSIAPAMALPADGKLHMKAVADTGVVEVSLVAAPGV